MSIHSHLEAASLALVLGVAAVACGGTHAGSQKPATAAAPARVQPSRILGRGPGAAEQQPGRTQEEPGVNRDQAGQGEDGDAELVVSRDVVARCPTLRLVKAHVAELDPDMVWLAVLEAIADCMSESGPMSAQSLGVSGDEEHRHVIREVLGSRGVAPTRVVAEPQSSAGAAECQAGTDCHKRVEITIIVP
jgi:hypothetical protein